MKNYNPLDWVAIAFLIVGGVNWGMIGAFNIDLVSSLLGDMSFLTRAVYGLVGLSALYMASTVFYSPSPTTARRVAHS
jgi:uncharacterized protein